MKVLLSILRDALEALLLPIGLLTLCALGLIGTAHAKGYRLSLYTVAPCAPAVQAAPQALSRNPLEAAP